jgi:MazG family protein
MNLKIIGLGIFSGDISVRAGEAIKKADCVILKSEKFKSAKIIKDAIAKERTRTDSVGLVENAGDGAARTRAGASGLIKDGAEVVVLDGFFESAEDFDGLNETVTEFVAGKAREYKNTVYLVNGPGNDDATAAALLRAGEELIPSASAGAYAVAAVMREEGENFSSLYAAVDKKRERPESVAAVVKKENQSGSGGGVFSPHASSSAGKSAKGGDLFSLFAATEIGAQELKDADCLFPDKRFCFIVKDIDDAFTASDVKLRLSDIYGDADVLLARGEDVVKTTLFEIDRQKVYDYRTVLIIPPSEITANKVHDTADLYRVMKRLRGRGGCEWDMAQTHKSIAINAIEEAYELVDAIDLSDGDKMREESGDVLLQALFHAVIAEDEGDFNVYEMLTALCEKLISRHTHIFGGDRAANAEEALSSWERAKAKEKKHENMTAKIRSVPKNFPALLRAGKVMRAAAKYGFEYADKDAAFDEIAGAFAGLRAAKTVDETRREGGGALLTVANYLRYAGVEPETALKDALNKTAERLEYTEAAVGRDGKNILELSPRERAEYRNAAEKNEK